MMSKRICTKHRLYHISLEIYDSISINFDFETICRWWALAITRTHSFLTLSPSRYVCVSVWFFLNGIFSVPFQNTLTCAYSRCTHRVQTVNDGIEMTSSGTLQPTTGIQNVSVFFHPQWKVLFGIGNKKKTNNIIEISSTKWWHMQLTLPFTMNENRSDGKLQWRKHKIVSVERKNKQQNQSRRFTNATKQSYQHENMSSNGNL